MKMWVNLYTKWIIHQHSQTKYSWLGILWKTSPLTVMMWKVVVFRILQTAANGHHQHDEHLASKAFCATHPHKVATSQKWNQMPLASSKTFLISSVRAQVMSLPLHYPCTRPQRDTETHGPVGVWMPVQWVIWKNLQIQCLDPHKTRLTAPHKFNTKLLSHGFLCISNAFVKPLFGHNATVVYSLMCLCVCVHGRVCLPITEERYDSFWPTLAKQLI